MARVLLTWELGSGYGHVVNLSTIAKALRKRGHQVVVALRDPSVAQSFFSPLGVAAVTAPKPAINETCRPTTIVTYADMLNSVGFDSTDRVEPVLDGWDKIYDEVDPDVVVFDHSPFALMAAAGRSFAKLQHSTGFCIPPDSDPLPVLRPWLIREPEAVQDSERRLLDRLNKILRRRSLSTFNRLADLYHATDENWLATYEELDHFGSSSRTAAPVLRQVVEEHSHLSTEHSSAAACVVESIYRGITPPPPNGVRPTWPNSRGPRIFAYLQPDATTLPLISALGKLGFPTVARVPGLQNRQEFERFRSLQVLNEAVDVSTMSQECDFAILSGGHGTVAAMLLAGKPVIVAPIQLEQLLLARCCEQAGFGIGVPTVDVRYFTNAVNKLISDPNYRQNARRFSDRYQTLRTDDQLDILVSNIEQLAIGC